MDSTEIAFNEGFNAALEGKETTENPYRSTPYNTAWKEGFLAGFSKKDK